jgi:hypothetical protein
MEHVWSRCGSRIQEAKWHEREHGNLKREQICDCWIEFGSFNE